jgi:hypothetical protein
MKWYPEWMHFEKEIGILVNRIREKQKKRGDYSENTPQ